MSLTERTIVLDHTLSILCLASELLNINIYVLKASPTSVQTRPLKRLAVDPRLFDETSMGGPCLNGEYD